MIKMECSLYRIWLQNPHKTIQLLASGSKISDAFLLFCVKKLGLSKWDVHNFAHPSLYYVGTEAKVIVGFRKEKVDICRYLWE